MTTPLRVLILEDQAADAELMVDELRSGGFEVDWTRVDTRADYASELSPLYDLILADYALPQFNGLGALQLLHDCGLDVPFIIVSGAIGEDLAVEAMRQGASDYVLKDRMARLGLAATRALEQKRLREDNHRAEQVLRDNEKRFRSLIENSSDGIALLDHVGTILYVSPSTTRILGYRAEQLVGQSAFQRIHPEDLCAAEQFFWRQVVAPRPDHFQFRYRHQNGSWVWLGAVSTNLFAEPCVQALVVNYRDITEWKRNEAEIRQLNSELELRVAQRTAELGRTNQELEAFTYSVSHDLRTPLAAIASFSGLLAEEKGEQLDTEGQAYLRLVRENAAQARRLVDDLLALSRTGQQALKVEAVEMNQLVRKVLEELGPETATRSVDIQKSDLPACAADPSLLKQVWMNLLSNALKYSRHRQVAVIQIGSFTQGEPREVVYFVKDNGVGFDMRSADKLFNPFQRLHSEEEYEGTGVGLAIVQRIIHRHGGRVWAEAQVDKGARFCFTLPAIPVTGAAGHEKQNDGAG